VVRLGAARALLLPARRFNHADRYRCTCTRWYPSRDVPLRAFGAESGEADWPNYVRFSVAQLEGGRPGRQFVYLTYAGGRVHAWDRDGERVGDATLQVRLGWPNCWRVWALAATGCPRVFILIFTQTQSSLGWVLSAAGGTR
jgi:hypothetical protein